MLLGLALEPFEINAIIRGFTLWESGEGRLEMKRAISKSDSPVDNAG